LDAAAVDACLDHPWHVEEIPMQRRNCVRIALVVSGIVAAGLCGSAADENVKPAAAAATAKARRDAAKKVYEGSWQHHLQTPEDFFANHLDFWHDWSVRWMQAERDLGRTNAEDIAAVEAHLKRMEGWKEMYDKKVKERTVPAYWASQAEFFQLEAQDWLAAAKAAGK
jgi:hypothetical protein